ncbi:glycosyltransferase family 4 protein [Novosphingobium sp. BL-52-GroH]|uniref:glycosyltransferase family 4 protein n=1 Tax=Novosphingobium sp. BL-52-GroH TaxID=3349877 RepID=UPI00384C8693
MAYALHEQSPIHPPAPFGARALAALAPGRSKLLINGRFLVQQATGVQRVACELTSEIDDMLERGELIADVTLLVPPGPWVQKLSVKRIKIETVGKYRGVLWEQFELPRYLGDNTLLCLGNSAPARTLSDRDRQVVVMIHDVSFLDHPRAYTLRYRMAHRWMLPLLLRKARAILTVSETERDRLVQLAPGVAGRITVAPNGGWSARADPTIGVQPALSPGYALYVGSLSHRKNFERTLAAAIRLAREDDLDFVFVGSTGGILRKPGCSVPRDVAHRIHFLGQVNSGELLAQIYRDARVLLFPSLYEACPLPPVEAAYFGCPVVVSNIPSMWERCGQSVTYCNPWSLDSIVGAVRRVLSDPRARSDAVVAARAMAARHSWHAQAVIVCKAIFGECPVMPEQGASDPVDPPCLAPVKLADALG